MPESMSEELTVMMELQRKDLELRRLLETRVSIPGVILERDRELDEQRKRIAEMEEELKGVSMKKLSFYGDVEAMENRIKEKETQHLRVIFYVMIPQ